MAHLGFWGGKRTTHPASPPSWFPYIDRRVRWWWHVGAELPFQIKNGPQCMSLKKITQNGQPVKGPTSPINQPRATPPIQNTIVFVRHFVFSNSKNLLKILRKLTQTVTEDKKELYGIMNQMILDSSILTFLMSNPLVLRLTVQWSPSKVGKEHRPSVLVVDMQARFLWQNQGHFFWNTCAMPWRSHVPFPPFLPGWYNP